MKTWGEGNGNPLQCSHLENPMDSRAQWAAVSGVAQSRTWLKRLSSSSSRHEYLSIIWFNWLTLSKSKLLRGIERKDNSVWVDPVKKSIWGHRAPLNRAGLGWWLWSCFGSQKSLSAKRHMTRQEMPKEHWKGGTHFTWAGASLMAALYSLAQCHTGAFA